MSNIKTKVFCGSELGIVTGLILVLAASFFSCSSVLATTYSATISTSGSVSLDVSANGSGAKVSSDNVIINSTCPLGYTLSISGPSDTTLFKDGDKTNTGNTTRINASTGTKQNPVSILGNNVKTWGYSLGTYSGNTHTSATINSDFIGLTSNIVELTNKNSASAQSGDTVPVYYGVSVDSSIEAGLYTMSESTTGANDNVINYYLTTSLNCTSYLVEFNPTSTIGGTTVSGTGTMSDQRIEEGVATNLATNSYTAPTGYYFMGWNTNQDGTGTSYTNGQQVTDLTTVGQTITLYAQWTDCPPNKICYDKNQGSDNNNPVVGTMGQQSITSSDTSTTLLASNYSRTNYGFAGWNTKADGTGTNLGPQETIEFTAGTYDNVGLKLYAKWIASAGNIQSWNGCATLNIGDVTALKDQRDNQVYAVARLADGNCWMIENLRLESTASHNSDGTLAQGYGTSSTYGNFSGLADMESTGFSSTYSANSLYSNDGSNNTINIGTSNNPANRMPRYNSWNNQASSANRPQSPTTNNATNSTTNAGMYSYGNYYTWHAAVADTTYNGTNNNSSDTTSLCPTGWGLPKGGDKTRIESNNDNGFWNLVVTGLNNGSLPANYNSSTYPYYTGNSDEGGPISNKLRSYPNNFLYSGYFSGSSASNRGTHGRYWSSTAYDTGNSYYLYLYSSSVTPGTNRNNKYYGFPIRCVIKPTYTLVYNGNGADSGSTMSVQNADIKEGDMAWLHPSNFKRAGYGFAGWSTTQINPDDADAASQVANAKIFGPQEVINLSQDEINTADNNGIITLYAVWVKSAGNLQNWSGCPSLTSGSVTALKDTRDNQVYAIAKLADGRCWMIENLRLNNSATLDTTNTNNPLNSNNTATIVNDDGNTTNHLSATSNSWCTDNNSACLDKSLVNTSNTTSTVADMTSDNQNVYSFGNYYNWYSATGGRGKYSNNTNNSNMGGSICPKGWRMPYGGDKSNEASNDFWTLIVNNLDNGVRPANYSSETNPYYSNNTSDLTDGVITASLLVRKFPNNFVAAGNLNGSNFVSRGTFITYHTPTSADNTNSYSFAANSLSSHYPGTKTENKYRGRPIRCSTSGS